MKRDILTILNEDTICNILNTKRENPIPQFHSPHFTEFLVTVKKGRKFSSPQKGLLSSQVLTEKTTDGCLLVPTPPLDEETLLKAIYVVLTEIGEKKETDTAYIMYYVLGSGEIQTLYSLAILWHMGKLSFFADLFRHHRSRIPRDVHIFTE